MPANRTSHRRLRQFFLAGTALTLATIAGPASVRAATDVYDAGAGDGDFNSPSNYVGNVSPTSADTAVYGSAGGAQTAIFLSNAGTTTVSGLTFNAPTSYNFILNDSHVLNGGALNSSSTGVQIFGLSGTAGVVLTSLTDTAGGGVVDFSSSSASSVVINGPISIGSSLLNFVGNAPTLVNSTFTSAGGNLQLADLNNGSIVQLESISDVNTGGQIQLGSTTLVISGAATTTYDGVIAGTGGVRMAGDTLTLGAADTYSGNTLITQGATLNAGVAGAVANSQIFEFEQNGTFNLLGFNQSLKNLTNSDGTGSIALGGADLTLGGALATTYAGTISGTGGVTYSGTGVLTLAGNNSYTGGTTLANGTVEVSSDANLGNTSGGITFYGGTLESSTIFNTARAVTLTGAGTLNAAAGTLGLTGAVTGTGALTIAGTGTVSLTGNNTFSGGVTINNGATLNTYVNSAGIGNIVDNGLLELSTPSGSETFAGTISGAGAVNATSGTVTLTGANTYTGGTTVSAGTLVGTTTSLQGAIVDNGVVEFNQSTSGAYTGALSGAGTLTNVGTGTVTLSGTNTYTGGTDIVTGTIAVATNTSIGTGTITLDGGALATTAAFTLNNAIAVNAGTNKFNTNGFADAITGVVSGPDALTVTGAGGGLALENASNTFAGLNLVGTTVFASNAAALGTGPITVGLGSTGIITLTGATTVTQAVNIGAASTLTINTDANADTVSGAIGGAGALTKTGTGPLTLGNTNSYSGGTIFNEGVVSIAAAGNLGAGALTFNGGTLQTTTGVTLVQGATLTGAGTIDADGNSSTLSGVIGGASTLTVTSSTGTGNVTLSSANTFSGGTFVNANTNLTLANATASGTGLVGLGAASSTLTLATSATVGGLGGAAGSIVNLGANTLTLSSGSLYDGTIVGTGALVKTGPAYQGLGATNTYAGGTTISGGTLLSEATNALGVGSLNVASGATLALTSYAQQVTALTGSGSVTSTGGAFRVGSGSFSGVYSGSGNLGKDGTGTLTLSGNNTYTGLTNIVGGTLALGTNNALSTTSPLAVGTNGTLTLGAFNQTVAGVSGAGMITATTGTLTNTGSGTFTGTAQSGAGLGQATGAQVLDGASTFASTIVSSGSLEVGDIGNTGATLTSPVTVTGGTLLGHGTIFGNVVNNGGTVQPGGTIGTLTLNGNYTQSAGSTLAIEVSPTAASRLAVNGSASLAGTLALDVDSGTYTLGNQYTIVSAANGVTGRFGTVTESGQAESFSETYTPNSVVLTAGGSGVTFATAGLTPNQANELGAINGILDTTSAGTFGGSLVLLGIGSEQNSPQLAGVLGELRADLATVDLANLTSFNNFLVERMDRRQGLTSTMEVNTGLPGTFDIAQNGDSDMGLFGPGGMMDLGDDRPSFWVHGYGVLGTLGDEPGFAEAQYRTGGIVGGADLKITDSSLVGAAVAYEHTDLNLSGDTAENNIDTYRVSLYGSSKLDPVGVPLTLDAALGYAFNDYHDSDFLPLPGSGFDQTSRHDGNELTAEAGLSQDVHIAQDLVSGALTIVPRIGVEYDNIQQNPYASTGAPAAGLDFNTNGSTLDALRGTIGARADVKFTTDDGTVVTPEVRATYLHDFMDTNVALTEAFTGAPTAGFTVSGVHPGREAALVGTGVTVGFSENISATIGYDAAVRDRELDHTVQVGIKYTW